MNGLNSTDICAIIKACKESDVSVLKYGEMEVLFFKPDDTEPVNYSHEWEEGGVLHHVPKEQVEINDDLSDNETDVENIEIDLNEAALSDPVLYEKIMHGGEA